MGMRVYLRDSPQRAIALVTETHVLILRHSSSSTAKNVSSTSLSDAGAPKCIVEFSPWETANMQDYRPLSSRDVYGTLGLVTLNGDVFLCVVTQAARAATVRPGEAVQRIINVEFHCLTRGDYDRFIYEQVNPFPTDGLDANGFETGPHA